MREARNPGSIHAPFGAYSHQIELRGEDRMLVLAGQVGVAPDGHMPEDVAEQFDLALANVLRNLEAASMDVGDLIKMTLYFTEPVDADRRRAILAGRLGHHEPCMTLLYVAGLAAPSIKAEVDAWASAAGPA
ncbi:MAG TPA: RidA family protein [Solirubrobacteraceae bacterium]|nr:RidA family protein [Solirubrobacteraceae bacterium]